ncbi:hypothetical protein MHYP_G00259130 [Metynnis hypsauchen]
MFLADLFLAQEKTKQEKAKRMSEGNRFHIRWVEKDDEGHPLQKRNRSGQTHKRTSASEAPIKNLNHFEITEEVPVLSESSGSQCLIDSAPEKQAIAKNEWHVSLGLHVVLQNGSRGKLQLFISWNSSLHARRVDVECDVSRHKKLVLHNIERWILQAHSTNSVLCKRK